MKRFSNFQGVVLCLLALLIFACLLPGCGGDSGGSSDGSYYRSDSSANPTTTGTVKGTVYDVATGTKLAYATVTIAGLSTTSDSEGNYSISGVPVGTQTITVSKSGFQTYTSTLQVSSTGADTEYTVYLPVDTTTVGTVQGTVTDQTTSAKLSGVTVSIGTLTTTTDANGAYTIQNVPAGTQTIAATKTGYTAVSSSVSVTAGQTTTKNISMSPGTAQVGTVQGTVTDQTTSAKLSGVSVAIGTLTATTDANGAYTIQNVPAGTQTITATKTGYTAVSSSVSVTAGQTTTKNISMTPGTAQVGTVQGTVTDQTTSAKLSGVSVAIGTLTATTDANGAYTIQNVPVGTQSIAATKTGYAAFSDSVTVAASQTTTKNISMTPGTAQVGTVQGTVTDQTTSAKLSGVTVSIGTLTATTDANGAYTIQNVPAGTQTITATKTGYAAVSSSVSVTAGQTTTKNIAMSAARFSANTNYKWQVEAVNANGKTSGPEWSFTTGTGLTPVGKSVNVSITEDAARRIALTHLKRNSQASTTIGDMKVLKDKSGSAILAFVFSLDPHGYIIVPSRAIAPLPPVIAYSFESNFSWEETSQNVLLSMVRTDISLRREAFSKGLTNKNVKAFSENSRLWYEYLYDKMPQKSSHYRDIGPLFTFTSWNQNPSPYWDFCPIFEGKNCYVGCAATAMAQICNYWKQPTSMTFTSSDSYTTEKNKIPIDATEASFSGLNYNNSNPDDVAKGKLSYACGVAIGMDYGPTGSGGNPEKAATALKERFGFGYTKSEFFGNEGATFSSANIIASINDNAPCMLSIWGTVTNNRHGIVCEGYKQSDNTFYLNYGWGGQSDGWYSLPEGMPDGYNRVYYNIYNIKPGTEPVLPGTPQNPSPSNGATNVYLDNQLKCDTCTNADSYNFYVWKADQTKPTTPTATNTTPVY
ncbi:MAG: carboxypeptidase regulatory-like domain-containing protein [Vulcanimicrobiota bacterium]